MSRNLNYDFQGFNSVKKRKRLLPLRSVKRLANNSDFEEIERLTEEDIEWYEEIQSMDAELDLITFEEDLFTFDLEESIADFASEANNAAAISLNLEVLLKQLSDEDAKLVSYLKITCDKSTKRTATYISRYGKFILWFMQHISHQEHLHFYTATREVIVDRHECIEAYTQHLKTVKKLLPGTVADHLEDIHKIFCWFVVFSSFNLEPKLTFSDLGTVKFKIAEIQKTLRLQEARRQDKKTMQTMIQTRQLPEGRDTFEQLQNLQRIVQQEAVKMQDVMKPISPKIYKHFLGLVVASLYVFCPQGRIHGPESIEMVQVSEMLEIGHTMTEKFKTSVKYGYQPIMIEPFSKSLIETYLEHYRSESSNPYLFITYKGENFKEAELGRYLTDFFIKAANLKVTSTNIRSIVETTAHDQYQKGEISMATRHSIMNINGHTSETVNKHYLHHDRSKDVAFARQFVSAVQPTNDIATQSSVTSTSQSNMKIPVTPAMSRMRHIEFGEMHPEYARKSPKKVKWSEEELDWMREWKRVNILGEDTEQEVARCLQAIRSNPEAHLIFHEHHVRDSGRLRSGYYSKRLDLIN